MKSSIADKAISSAGLAPPSNLKKEVPRDRPLSGLPPAHISPMETSQDHDTRTSRTGRVIKAPTAFTPSPAAVTSGKRKGGSRKKEANVVCIHCNRGQSPATNAIVFCDGCNNTWHQKCHDPPIDNKVILVKDMEWICRKCKPPRRPSMAKSKPVKVKKSGRTLHPRLQAGPPLEAGADGFTADERRAYLSSLSHAQLVELLVNISSKNPSVPMFPTNMTDLPASQFFYKPKRNEIAKSDNVEHALTPSSNKRTRAEEDSADPDFTTNPRKRSRTTSIPAKSPPKNLSPDTDTESLNHLNPLTTATPELIPPSTSTEPKIGPGTPANQSQGDRISFLSRDTTPEDDNPDTEDDSFEDTVEDHRLYPRAGNGFSPALDPEDLKILNESPDSHTFSHSMYGPAKKAKELNVPPRVWQSHR
ncbi:uncharacterized protein N7458_007856 [Penicillium daleae]|uniref:PHD-type domain-containing protein n=1 Tax=Penicillium daleae TaxID=63821 RepID=A0AAD6C2N8_9EURO|nr:uncharacterized protein N7458_007856 [Penicillium daleae]KAJ5443984.1 hypothetical protein N7458_007856 [Penicillium daleae]